MRFRTIIFGIPLLLLLNGCKTLPGLEFLTGSKSSDPASVENTPVATRFRVGDHYTFDNPVTRWQVVAIDGAQVSWLSDNGDRQVTGFNPMLPAREWRSKNGATGKRIIRDVKGALFPMKVGATMSFRATVTSNNPPFGWEYIWSCRVTGRETVTMLGDEFDTFVVVCGRENPDELTFNYAPKIGHYIVQRVAATAQSPVRTRRLVAYKYGEIPPVAQTTTAPEKPLSTPKGKVEAAARMKAEATARKKTAAAAFKKAEAAARKKAEAIARKKMETAALKKAEAAARMKAKAAARKKAEAAAQIKSEAAARKNAEAAALRKIEAAALKKAKAWKKAATEVNPGRLGRVSSRAGDARSRFSAAPAVPNALASIMLRAPDFGGNIAPKAAKAVSAGPVQTAGKKSVARKPVVTPRLSVAATPVRAAKKRKPESGPAPVAAMPRSPEPKAKTRRAVPPPPKPVAMPPKPPVPSLAGNLLPAVPAPRKPPAAADMGGNTRMAAVAATGVHLASYRVVVNARRGWDQLTRRNGDLLRGLRADIRRVDVGEKGVYYRLYAVPVTSAAAAAELCRKLRLRGVFCEPENS